MLSISKYYKLAALVPLGITTISGIILSLTHDGSTYKSEWFTDDGFRETVFLTILLSGLIAILSLMIFLNRNLKVTGNSLLSFVSWIVPGGALCVFIVYQEYLNFSGHSDINGVYEGNRLLDGYILVMALVHLTGLITTYLFFRYRLKRQNSMVPNIAA